MKIPNFMIGEFLLRLVAQGGEVTDVYYYFTRTDSTGPRRVISFDPKRHTLRTYGMLDKREFTPDRDFLYKRYVAGITPYVGIDGKSFGRMGVLITLENR